MGFTAEALRAQRKLRDGLRDCLICRRASGGALALEELRACLIESCRRMQIPARDYLAAALPGLADTSIQRLAELTPTAWAARNR